MRALWSERSTVRLRQETLHLLVIAAVVAVAYIGYLAWQNRRAEALLENLRQNDPIRYLDDIRRSQGFESYLGKYRLLENFVLPTVQVPSFLVGRWTLKKERQRVAAGTVFSDCHTSVIFEKGLIEFEEGGKRTSYKAFYRIADKRVVISGPKFVTMPVALGTYGGAIDHIELSPPGSNAVLYGYFCRR